MYLDNWLKYTKMYKEKFLTKQYIKMYYNDKNRKEV